MTLPGFARAVFLSHVNAPGMPIYPDDPPFELTGSATVAGDGFYLQRVVIGEHSGTHWGAPAHLLPGGATGDRVAAEALIGPACVVDVRAAVARDPDLRLGPGELRAFEARYGAIPRGAFVVAWTGFSERWADPTRYLNTDPAGVAHYPGFAADAARWLVTERAVAGLGIDTMGVDPGDDPELSVSRLLFAHGRIHVENLTGLADLPATGAWIIIGGLRTRDGSGGPATVFGLVP